VFLIRNIANLVPPYEPDQHHHSTSAAIEYAVRILKVGQFVVLGHAGCGGIRALLDPPAPPTDFINLWLQTAASARDTALLNQDLSRDERQRCCELQALKSSLANLLEFPWLKARIEDGSLQVDALYLDLERGELLLYQRQSDTFARV
jgi:carbonic anhydrase